MKLNKWFYGAMALSMLAACSSEDAPRNENGKPEIAFKGDGYLAIQINLPVESSVSRANDNFGDGTSNEYAVTEAAIALFKGTSEADATFVKVIKLDDTTFETDDPNNDNVTSTSTAFLIDNLELATDETLYGLALINYNGVVDITVTANGDGTTTSSMKVGTTTITSFADLQGVTISNNELYNTTDKNHFFMTNAILSDVRGGANDPGTTPGIFQLVELSRFLYDSKTEALANPSGCIYVERAVAKITSGIGDNAKTIQVGDNETGKVTLEVSYQYVIDNTEPSSYLIRKAPSKTVFTQFEWNLANINATGNNKYRMIGHTQMPVFEGYPHQYEYYRTYFCQDPNGPGIAAGNSLKSSKVGNDYPFVNVASTNPFYCYENTFTVTNQNHGNTTRAIFKVTMKPQGQENAVNLYVMDNDRTSIYTVTQIDKKFTAEVLGYQDAVRTALEALAKKANPTATMTVTEAEKYISTELEDVGTDRQLKSVALNTTAEGFDDVFGTATNADFKQALKDNGFDYDVMIENINNHFVLTKYEGGVSYFEVYIKHFGDDQTKITTINGTTTAEVYTKDPRAGNYLGRYGLVRNNWYDITVSDIIGMGSVTVPTIDFTLSDDNKKEEKYMSAEIHILSWAKRTQSEIF